MFRSDRLKKLRTEKGLTQKELAKSLGASRSIICCYEKGTRTPPYEITIAFMQIFNVTADYFLGTDHPIKTVENKKTKYEFLSNEELILIKELRKDKMVYDIIFDDPKRGAEIIKSRVG